MIDYRIPLFSLMRLMLVILSAVLLCTNISTVAFAKEVA